MPRALIVLLIAALTLGGCVSSPPVRVEQCVDPNAAAAPSGIERWLAVQAATAGMEIEQVTAELAAMEKPATPDGLFHFALLNQQSQTYNGWTQARDILRQLGQDSDLSEQQRQLASILEEYNQNRINWDQRYGTLQQQYDELRQQADVLEQEKLLLEQKIQAITDLEATISTRKEP